MSISHFEIVKRKFNTLCHKKPNLRKFLIATRCIVNYFAKKMSTFLQFKMFILYRKHFDLNLKQ